MIDSLALAPVRRDSIAMCAILSGRASEINEQKIGTMLFGRSSHYDSSIDGIVRTQASRLRQRLDIYFSGEGAAEPIRIILPRGSYVPVFEAHGMAVTPPLAEPTEVIPAIPHLDLAHVKDVYPKDLFVRRWSPWGLCLVLSLTLVALWIHDHRNLRPAVVVDYPKHALSSHLFNKKSTNDGGCPRFRLGALSCPFRPGRRS